MGDVVEDPRDHAPADNEHERNEGSDLADGQRQGGGDGGRARQTRRRGRPAFRQQTRQGRQQDQRQHHDEVLDDEPADDDPPAVRVEQVALLEGPQEHDRAGDGQGEAEDEPAAGRPAQRPGQAHPEQRRDGDLHDGAGHGNAPHRQQVLDGEMHADAEHQQDDADLRQLRRQRLIGDEPRRMRADGDSGQEVADQRREPEPIGDRSEQKRQHQPEDDGGDERRVVRHASPAGSRHGPALLLYERRGADVSLYGKTRDEARMPTRKTKDVQ